MKYFPINPLMDDWRVWFVSPLFLGSKTEFKFVLCTRTSLGTFDYPFTKLTLVADPPQLFFSISFSSDSGTNLGWFEHLAFSRSSFSVMSTNGKMILKSKKTPIIQVQQRYLRLPSCCYNSFAISRLKVCRLKLSSCLWINNKKSVSLL